MMPLVDELRRDLLMAGDVAPVWYLDGSRALELGDAVIAIGAFDGVHRGHGELMRRTVSDARARGMRAYAVTFDPDPDTIVSPAPARHLMTVEDRLHALAATGVDGVIVVPFTRELAAFDHERFFGDVLQPCCRMHAIHVGSDFRLGAHGASDVAVMRAWGIARGIDVHGHDLVLDGGAPVSATRIRTLLADGSIEHANDELGRRYLVRGRIITGRGQGTALGFPTANIAYDASLQLPAAGVYAGLACVDGTVWPAAINVGLPPTFEDRCGSASLEANLIGFSGDIYGDRIDLLFDEHLRPSFKFDDIHDLIDTVQRDIAHVGERFGHEGVSIS